jgi:hypothetical protein
MQQTKTASAPNKAWTFFSVFMVYPENMLTFAAVRN